MIDTAPYYALRMRAGDLGTKGGLVYNENGQVLRADGSVIDGLYATGNTSASVMGNDYAGAGATIGPAMVSATSVPATPPAASDKAKRWKVSHMSESVMLSDKVVLVTGGARGLGAAFARRIVEGGGKVVIADVLDDDGRTTAAELGDAARYVHLDVTDADAWRSAVEFTVAEFGSLTGLVNNAGVSTGQYIEHEPLEHFRQVLDINLVGVFNGIQAVIAPMRSAGGGRS